MSPRKAFISSPDFPYHVYNRTEDKNFYGLPLKDIWDIYSENLAILSAGFDIKIHAFVLMSNHYHLAASAPSETLPNAIRYLQSQVSRQVGEACKTQKYRFGQRYKWKLIAEHGKYQNLIRYIYQNPVRAKLCVRTEDYPWSSLSGLYGRSSLGFPISPSIYPDQIDEKDPDYFLEWTNASLLEDDLSKVRGMFKKERGKSKKETGT